MSRHLRRAGILLLAAALLLAACSRSGNQPGGSPTGQKGPNGEVYGGTYRVAIAEEPPGIDPQVDTTLQVYNLSRNIFNTLVRYRGESLELEPELLSEMPKVDADNKTYHFKLRQDVKFTNGAQLTAKDVKFTFERMLLPATKAANTWVLQEIQGAQEMLDSKATELSGFKITGDYSFDIILARPYGPFLQNLATPPASIFPAEYTKEAGDGFQRRPVGSGPFKLADWQPNALLVLERNPDYWEKGYPFLDKVEYRVVAEEATRWLEFEKGNTDESGIPTAEFDNATKSGTWVVKESIPLNTYYLSLDTKSISDKRVRQAISLAIDRQKILTAIHHGQGTVAKQFVTPGIPGALSNPPGFKYDPAQARELLKQAGVTNLKIQAWQNGTEKVSDTNLALQQMLAEVGIDFAVNMVDRTAFREARSQGKIQANYGNWWADYPDPDNYLYTYFQSESSKSMSVNWNEPAVDQILNEARALADQAKRQQLYQQLEQRLIYDEYAIIPLWHMKEYFVTQRGVHGILAHPTGVSGMKTVWKDAAAK